VGVIPQGETMEFKLPEIGEGVHEGEVVSWKVKEGQSVKLDETLVEIMTDKATVEIPAPFSGQVTKLHAKEGEIVKVGALLVSYESTASTATQKTSPLLAPTKNPTAAVLSSVAPVNTMTIAAGPSGGSFARPLASPLASPGNTLATPATRRLARDLSVNLSQVPATGPHGRVTKEDVQRFVGATAAGPQVPSNITASYPSHLSVTTSGTPMQQQTAETLVPFRGVRRKIAEAMTKSRFTIPEFTYVDECDVTELVSFRQEAKPHAEKEGVKLTYMPFIIKAVIRGLKEFPYLNSVLDEQGGNIILKNYYNIGIAVDTPEGLIVPVVKNADKKSILELARDTQTLAEKSKNKKLALEDLQGGTFTITNAGNIGGLLATPIINWPEVAIFGVHKVSKKPIVKTIDGKQEIVAADTIWLSVAVDHRVVDGAIAGRFMNVVMDYLSHPKKMLLEMA